MRFGHSPLFINARGACSGSHQQVYTLPNGTEPLVFLDFKNGVYTADGEAVALSALLTEDVNYGDWNPARIEAGVGLVGNSDVAPIFTGDALDLILSGSTTLTVLTGTSAASNAFRYEMADSLVDFNTYYFSGLVFTDVEGPTSFISDQVAQVDEDDLTDGLHKSAVTFVEGKISRSTDGAAIITINPAAAWSPAMTAMGFVVPGGITVETIGIYPAQDDADLPGLSAL